MIQKQFFRVFYLFAPKVKDLYQINTKEIANHIHLARMIKNMK